MKENNWTSTFERDREKEKERRENQREESNELNDGLLDFTFDKFIFSSRFGFSAVAIFFPNNRKSYPAGSVLNEKS